MDAAGNPIPKMHTMRRTLSEVSPVNDGNGDLTWFAGDGRCPAFYTVRPDGTHETFDPNPFGKGATIRDRKSRGVYVATNPDPRRPEAAFARLSSRDAKRFDSLNRIRRFLHLRSDIGQEQGVQRLQEERDHRKEPVMEGEEIFSGCRKLKTMTVPGKELRKADWLALSDVDDFDFVIRIPKSKKEQYTKLFREE